MKRIAIVMSIVTMFGAGCASAPSTPPVEPTVPPAATTPSQPSSEAPTTTSTKFADQDYYSSSYLISGETLSDTAKTALTGFQMTKTTSTDGATTITLKALKAGYQDQQYTLKKGEQLYFIERFLQDDDQEKNEDRGMRDDLAAVVDAEGNVVQSPTNFTETGSQN